MRGALIAMGCCLLVALPCAAARGQAAGGGASQSQPVSELTRLSAEVVRLHGEGKYDEAIPLAERALELSERSFGSGDRRVADALSNLAALWFGKKEYEKAGALYQRALPVYEATAGADAEQTVGVLNRLIVIAVNRRDFGRADKLSQRVVEITEKRYGADNIETARALVSRAELYRIQGDTKKARDVYARILDIAEKSPPESVRIGITQSLVNYLGILYARGADDAETERINRLLRVVRDALSEPGQPVRGGVLNGKAVYRAAPEYPPVARENRDQGTVVVQVLVDETGKVIEARAVSGASPALRQAAESAARRWRFTPTLLSGVPVKVSGTITFNFALR